MHKLHGRIDELRWWNANKHRKLKPESSIWLVSWSGDLESGYSTIQNPIRLSICDYGRRDELEFEDA